MTESSPTRFWSRRAALAGLAASVAAPATFAQTAGSRPIRIIVGFAPGSANDLIARELARYMAEPLGQPVIVENKPGAGGSLGTEMVAKAAPDGLTVGLGTSSQMVMNVALYRNLPFDVERDLRQIGLVGRTPLVLAGKAAGAKKLKELIAAARANPGQISYGSGGTGSISHIVGEAFARAVDMVFDGIITSQPMAQQGRVRLLAFGGRKRSPVIPDVPTFAEQGLRDYDAYSWNCLFAPAKVADADITRLNQALNAALALPAMQERLARGGSDNLGPSTPAQADAFGRKERERWVPFVRSLKIETA